MKTHHLKTWPKFFKDMRDGLKTFELRKNDRDFKVGDILVLDEYNPDKKAFTGSHLTTKVTYMLTGEDFGLKPEHCIMGLDNSSQGGFNFSGEHEEIMREVGQ